MSYTLDQLELTLILEIEELTIPVAKYHEIIVAGNAMIYLILCVKFNRRQKLPKNPQPREIAFKIISLYMHSSESRNLRIGNKNR